MIGLGTRSKIGSFYPLMLCVVFTSSFVVCSHFQV